MKKQITGGIVVLLFFLTLGFGPFGSVGLFQNSWSTNRPPTAVQGVDNLSVINLPQSKVFAFFGDNTNTIVRQFEATNIALNIATNRIASSNANYVLKYNGASDGQTATNLTVIDGSLYDQNTLALFHEVDGNLWIGDDAFPLLLLNGPTTNTSTLDVADDVTTYGGLSALGGIASSGISVFNTGVKFPSMTAGKLANFQSIGGSTYLSNSAYSDQTLADLQAATNSLQTQLTAATNALNVASNALRTAVGTTNNYILSNAGPGTNNTFYSATNTAQASNQVVETFKGVTGQTNNLIEWGTNNSSGNMIRQGLLSANGALAIGSSTIAAGRMLDVTGIGRASSWWESPNFFINSGSGGYFGPDGTGFHPVTGTNRFVNSSDVAGTGSILASNIIANGNTTITGPFTNKSTIYAPTNTAPTKTISSGGLHVLTLGKGWTNDLGGRADLVMQVKFTDAATGDPSFAFTNTTSGVSWTNGIAFGLTANTTMNITEPDIDPNDTGSLTDLSGTGATVTILQAWWKVH